MKLTQANLGGKAPLIEHHYFLYQMALFHQKREGGNLKEIMKTKYNIEISDEQAKRIKKEFKI